MAARQRITREVLEAGWRAENDRALAASLETSWLTIIAGMTLRTVPKRVAPRVYMAMEEQGLLDAIVDDLGESIVTHTLAILAPELMTASAAPATD